MKAPTGTFSRTEVDGLARMHRAVDLMRQAYPEMPAQMMSMFLLVALAPGISMRDLMVRAGIGKSAVSRNIATLADTGYRLGTEPLRLVDAYEDPQDRRNKLVTLTTRGERLARQIIEAINR